MISLVLSQPNEKSLIARANLSDVDDFKIIIIEDINALLLAEVHFIVSKLACITTQKCTATTAPSRSPVNFSALPE